MKKLISAVLGIALLLSVSTSALATEETAPNLSSQNYCSDVIAQISDSLVMPHDEGTQLDLNNSCYLYNFSDQPIAIFYKLDPVGYAIYDYTGSTVLEYTTECDHPFYTDLTQRYYYEGVFNYYKSVPEGFENLATGQIKSETQKRL